MNHPVESGQTCAEVTVAQLSACADFVAETMETGAADGLMVSGLGSGKGRRLRVPRARLPRELGAQLVEFALVLPMALVVLTFIFAVGVYCTQSLDLTNATSISGQYMILLRGTTLATDPCKTFVQTFEATAPIFNTSNLTFNFTLNGTKYSNVTTCTAGAAGLTQGATATFSVSYPCSLGIYGAQLAPGCTLKSQVTEIIQ